MSIQTTDALSFLRPLTDYSERDTQWLVPQRMPRGQINLLCGDGGTGKTAIWCDLSAAVTTGRKAFFDPRPDSFRTKPGTVVFFSAEDAIEEVLKPRLRLAGADQSKIFSASLQDPQFRDLKFGSDLMRDIVLQLKPDLLVCDPWQGFLPPDCNMGARNQVRAVLTPLIGLGEATGCTFLLIVHTNKRSASWGRNRIADSSDLWDAARSVLIAGETVDGCFYLAHEKCNYGKRQQTALYSITENGTPELLGYSDKGDRDFVSERDNENRQRPQRAEAENFILGYLQKGRQLTQDLDGAAQAQSISRNTLSRAKKNLKDSGLIGYRNDGYGKDKKWYIFLTEKGALCQT